MNIAEANLLDRSFDRLGDTLLRNRMLAEQQREREAAMGLQRDELASRMRLQRDELAGRTADREDARENRRLMLETQREMAANLAKYREAMANAANEKERWGILVEMSKNGMLTEEGIAKMNEEAGKMYKEIGVGVKLFKLPETTGAPQVWEDEPSGRRFGYRPGSKEMHDLTPNMGTMTEEEDPETGRIKRRWRRRLSPKDLIKPPVEPVIDETGGPTPEEEAQLNEIMSRPEVPASQPAARIKQRIQELQRVPPTIEGAGAAGAVPEFQTEDAARAAGHKAGDVVRLMINGKMTKVRLK